MDFVIATSVFSLSNAAGSTDQEIYYSATAETDKMAKSKRRKLNLMNIFYIKCCSIQQCRYTSNILYVVDSAYQVSLQNHFIMSRLHHSIDGKRVMMMIIMIIYSYSRGKFNVILTLKLTTK